MSKKTQAASRMGKNINKPDWFLRLHFSGFIRIWGFIFILLLGQSCSWFRKASSTPHKKDEVGEIQTKKRYNPQTGKYEDIKDVTDKMDTVKWKEDTRRPPIKTTEPKPESVPVIPQNQGDIKKENSSTKSVYHIGVLLPFFSDKLTDSTETIYPKSAFAIEYYCGLKLALDVLKNEGMDMVIDVADTKSNDFNSILNRKEIKKEDLIIGPAEKDNIPAANLFSITQNINIISPYYPSLDLDKGNPNFIQVNPSLKTHCEAITKHVLDRYKPSQVVLVCREKDNESLRFKYFQDANALIAGSSKVNPLKELVVTEDAPTLFKTDFTTYFHKGEPTVFIVPSWSESFIAAFLRKLDIDRKNNDVVVYGMPQWLDFQQITYDYYDRLNIHVSSSSFIDPDKSEVKDFKKVYFELFGKVPEKEAYLGYDTGLYFGRLLKKYGTKFQYKMDAEQFTGLQTRFFFYPVIQPQTTGSDLKSIPIKFENKYVNILKFKDYYFQLDE